MHASIGIISKSKPLIGAGSLNPNTKPCSFAQVWVETAAGASPATATMISGSCAGQLSVSSVLFGEEAREWGVAEELDMRLTLEITIDRQVMNPNMHTE